MVRGSSVLDHDVNRPHEHSLNNRNKSTALFQAERDAPEAQENQVKLAITVADVLRVFPGAKVVDEPEISQADRQAINDESAHWTKDREGVWHRVERTVSDPCEYCGGKRIDARWPDGSRRQCAHCGRAAKNQKRRERHES